MLNFVLALVISPILVLWLGFLMFLRALLGPLFGALAGFFLGITAIGVWVSDGFMALGLTIPPGQLWLVGAALGFVGAFFRPVLTVDDNLKDQITKKFFRS